MVCHIVDLQAFMLVNTDLSDDAGQFVLPQVLRRDMVHLFRRELVFQRHLRKIRITGKLIQRSALFLIQYRGMVDHINRHIPLKIFIKHVSIL